MLQEFSNISLEERAVLNVEEKNKILSDSIRSIEEPLIEDCGFDDPLDMARYNEVDYFKRLSHQELKSSARACDCYGNTALHMASANGHNEIVKLLLDNAEADPNVANKELNTPGHWVALNNQIETMKLLLEKGIDLNALNKHGKSVFEEANTEEMIQLMSKFIMERSEVKMNEINTCIDEEGNID